MITTTKQEIRKAVMEALEGRARIDLFSKGSIYQEIYPSDFPSVADLVAETLGKTEEPQKPQWTLESPCHWAESVKMADEMGWIIKVEDSKYYLIFDFIHSEILEDGPFKTIEEIYNNLKGINNGTI